MPACPWLAPLSSLLLPWYDRQVRALGATPLRLYGVWVSEIMLQQTRIEAVLSYYDRFMKAFPTIRDLADAPEDVLMKQWEGLGYYSRARNPQKTARMVRDTGLPADYEASAALARDRGIHGGGYCLHRVWDPGTGGGRQCVAGTGPVDGL